MLRSSLCDLSDAYILVKWTTTVPHTTIPDADPNKRHTKVKFKSCVLFTDCMGERKNWSCQTHWCSNTNV